MNKKQNKYIYGFAKIEDGKDICTLLETGEFKGNIGLVYSKRPNAVLSALKDGYDSKIAIVTNKYNNEISGMGICTLNNFIVNGNIEKTAYLSGFRILKGKIGNIFKVYKMFEDYCRENNVKYTYTTILDDNKYALKMFSKKRKNMPDYVKIADYTVNILMKNIKYKSNNICKKTEETDYKKLEEFIQKESKNKQFFPYIDLNNGFFNLTYKDFYTLKNKDGEILACGILWNQTDYKQLIVKHYSFKYKIISMLSKIILKPLNYPFLPKTNDKVNYSTLSFVLVKNDNGEYLNDFIKQISHFVKEDLFVYASTKTQKISKMQYKSNIYIVDWNKNFDKNKFNFQNLYIECGLL